MRHIKKINALDCKAGKLYKYASDTNSCIFMKLDINTLGPQANPMMNYAYFVMLIPLHGQVHRMIPNEKMVEFNGRIEVLEER